MTINYQKVKILVTDRANKIDKNPELYKKNWF